MLQHCQRNLVLLVAVFLFAAVQPALAQSAMGRILGTIQDASGAVIPHVTVNIINLQTDIRASVTSNERGDYISLPLSVGIYRVEAQMTGFKRAIRSGITLEVQQNARVDLLLEVGELAEQVEVAADAPLLETTSSALGRVVDNRRILALPLNTRNVYALVTLTPGIAGSIGDRFDGMNWSAY